MPRVRCGGRGEAGGMMMRRASGGAGFSPRGRPLVARGFSPWWEEALFPFRSLGGRGLLFACPSGAKKGIWVAMHQGLKPMATIMRPPGEDEKEAWVQGLKPLATNVHPSGEGGGKDQCG